MKKCFRFNVVTWIRFRFHLLINRFGMVYLIFFVHPSSECIYGA